MRAFDVRTDFLEASRKLRIVGYDIAWSLIKPGSFRKARRASTLPPTAP
jgi:hypothetical protein